MTQEEKNLLLKDLCSRLPYLIKVGTTDNDGSLENVWDIHLYNTFTEDVNLIHFMENESRLVDISEIRPYLRPLSSMTPEEKKYIKYKWGYSDWDTLNDFINYTLIDTCDAESFIDWLNSKHFDYRCLIEKGLAIEAPEGMYNF